MRHAIRHLKASDPILCQIIQRVGPYAITYSKPEFATLVRSIVYQQLSGKAAATICNRLLQAAGRLTPSSILTLTEEELRAVGLSNQKMKYIRDLAEKTHQRVIRFRQLDGLPDEGVIEHLICVKGVGVWTAHMFLIFALQRPDILPVGDLGIQSAIKRAYGLDALPKPIEVLEIAKPWRPYASVASWYLWRSLEGQAEV